MRIRKSDIGQYIKQVNPIAKAMLTNRKSKQVVKPKKGKGSYERKEKHKSLRDQEF